MLKTSPADRQRLQHRCSCAGSTQRVVVELKASIPQPQRGGHNLAQGKVAPPPPWVLQPTRTHTTPTTWAPPSQGGSLGMRSRRPLSQRRQER